MEIKTKYNVGDALYFIENNKIINREIEHIGVKVTENLNISIKYYCYTMPKEVMDTNPLIGVNEEDCFPTKEELIKSL